MMENNLHCSRLWEVYVPLEADRQERLERRAGEGCGNFGFDVIGNSWGRRTQRRLHRGSGMWMAMGFSSSQP